VKSGGGCCPSELVVRDGSRGWKYDPITFVDSGKTVGSSSGHLNSGGSKLRHSSSCELSCLRLLVVGPRTSSVVPGVSILVLIAEMTSVSLPYPFCIRFEMYFGRKIRVDHEDREHTVTDTVTEICE
jgi:hypothetical protein